MPARTPSPSATPPTTPPGGATAALALADGTVFWGTGIGAGTEKMLFGHRGANHPVKDLATGKVEITSQNHGFVVVGDSLPKGVRKTHVSLFDGSLEGLAVEGKPVFSVQYHPEASPGPHDSHHLFERFVEMMETTRSAK